MVRAISGGWISPTCCVRMGSRISTCHPSPHDKPRMILCAAVPTAPTRTSLGSSRANPLLLAGGTASGAIGKRSRGFCCIAAASISARSPRHWQEIPHERAPLHTVCRAVRLRIDAARFIRTDAAYVHRCRRQRALRVSYPLAGAHGICAERPLRGRTHRGGAETRLADGGCAIVQAAWLAGGAYARYGLALSARFRRV